MKFSVRYIQERRLSLKLLSGKIRNRFPRSLYPIVVRLRYQFFPRDCGASTMVKLSYSDGSWIHRKTTRDLRNIQTFLAGASRPLKVLQVGVGNSSLFQTTGDRLSELVGITVVQDEVDFAQQSFPDEFGSKYKVNFCNKYSSELSFLGTDFDYIVDNDLSSYACCKKHFGDMLRAYSHMLAKDGQILIGFNGLGYFDSGFGLTVPMAEDLLRQYDLHFERREHCFVAYRAHCG